MASEPIRCKGTNSEGEPCQAPPEFVDPLRGYCRNHDPEAGAERRRIARLGGEAVKAAAKARRLLPSDLPPLDSPEAARAWSETIGVAAATGVIPATSAQAALRAVAQFLKAYEVDELRGRLDALKAEIERLRAGGGAA